MEAVGYTFVPWKGWQLSNNVWTDIFVGVGVGGGIDDWMGHGNGKGHYNFQGCLDLVYDWQLYLKMMQNHYESFVYLKNTILKNAILICGEKIIPKGLSFLKKYRINLIMKL